MGINCTYDPISLSFQFFLIHLSKYVKFGRKNFQFHTKSGPLTTLSEKSNRMKYDSLTKWVSFHSVMISHEPHMSLKSH